MYLTSGKMEQNCIWEEILFMHHKWEPTYHNLKTAAGVNLEINSQRPTFFHILSH